MLQIKNKNPDRYCRFDATSFTMRVCVATYSYTGRAHPSMRNMRPMAPPKDRLMRAAGRQEERGEDHTHFTTPPPSCDQPADATVGAGGG